MSASTAPTPEKKTGKPLFGKGFVIVVVAIVALTAATYAVLFFTSKPVKMEPIWKGTGTVVSLHDVPASQVTHTECVGMKPMVCTDKVENIPESWALTVRVDSGEDQTFPITRGQFDTLHPGDTFTRK